jgi:hypothetical protein
MFLARRLTGNLIRSFVTMAQKYEVVQKGTPNSKDFRIFLSKFNFDENTKLTFWWNVRECG